MMKRRIIILAGWLVVWQLVSIWVGNNILMVGPPETLEALLIKMITADFWKTVGCSLLRIAAGFFTGAFVGLIIAALSARFPIIEDIFSPVLTLMKAIPVASFVVLFLIWWRSNVLATAITFFIVLPQIYVSTLEGLRNTDGKLLEMANVFHISGWNRFFYIYRPALKPFLDSSIRIAAGMSWKSGVAAEVIGTPDFSIGESLYMSKIYLDTAGVLAWTVVIILASLLFEKIVLALWRAFANWEPVCLGNGIRKSDACMQEIAVRVENLSKAYGEQKVVSQMNAEYKAGETYYFRTPSGSGKTTYFRLLAGLEKPDSGRISGNLQRTAMVFQEDRLCEEYDAVKNVELVTGNREVARKQLLCLLDEADIRKPCRELSGGMKRRVALVRAYAADSDILLLDEPFTGLDSRTREHVSKYMEEHQMGRTVFIATHI